MVLKGIRIYSRTLLIPIFILCVIISANAQISASEDFIYSPSPITSTYPLVNGTINLGHSIGAGYGLTGSIIKSYPYYLEKYFGLTNSVNYSVSGVGVRNQYLNFVAKNPAIPRLTPITVMLGVNEIRNGIDTLHRFAHIGAGFRAIAAAQFIESIQFYQTGTLPLQNKNIINSNNDNFFSPTIDTLADWGSRAYWYQKNDLNNSKMNFWIKNKITANETVTILNVSGSTIAIGTWGCDSSRTYLSKFSITVDGIDKGIYNPNQKTYSMGALVNPDFGLGGFGSNLHRLGLINDAIIITGLTETLHTVVLTFLDGGKYGAWDYIAELKKPEDCQQLPFYFWDLSHCNTLGYNYQGYSFTQEMIDSASSRSFQNLKSTFHNYPIFEVNTNRYFDPVAYPSMVQPDGLHPTTAGDSAISLALLDLVNKNRTGSIYQWKTLAGVPNQLSVTSGGLLYSGYKGALSTAGNNKLSLVAGNTEIVNGFADLNKDGNVDVKDAVDGGSVYYSFLINITDTAGLAENRGLGAYFAAISDSTGSNSHTAMIFVKKGALSGFQLGLKFNTDNSNTTVWATGVGDNMVLGATYLIVLRYNFNTNSSIYDMIDMWINPPVNNLMSPLLTLRNSGNTSDLMKIGSLIFRQGTNTPSIDIDGILLSDKWSMTLLPLNILSFTVNGKTSEIDLAWKTANEINSSNFIIQRSTNGNKFIEIGKVDVKGGGDYNFTDSKLPSATSLYYRLQIVDKDGSYTYSKVVVMTREIGSKMLVLFPNPVKDNLFVQFKANKVETVRLQIINMQGKALHEELRKSTIGFNNFNISTNNLPKGTYVVLFKGQDLQQKLFIKE